LKIDFGILASQVDVIVLVGKEAIPSAQSSTMKKSARCMLIWTRFSAGKLQQFCALGLRIGAHS